MNENEIIDDSLLENIEGLLFSEEYADSEDNSSLISEIADAEIPTEENSDENYDGAKESDASKRNAQNNNIQENVLNIDYSEDDFEKGFDSFAIERLSDSIRTNKGARRLFVEKASVKKAGLIANSPVRVYKESEQISLHSFMREGFGAESLRDSVESVKIAAPSVSPAVTKITATFAKPEKPKTPARDVLCVEKSKAPAKETYCNEKSNKIVEKDNGLKFESVNTDVPKISKDSGTINVFAKPEKPKTPARDALLVEKSKAPAKETYCNEKSNKIVEKGNGLKFDSVNTDVPKISKDSEKINVFASPERPKAPARNALRVEKTNKTSESGKEQKISSINTDVPKVSKDAEKTKFFASPEKPKASARDSFGDERLNKSVDVCKETKCDPINKEISKASSVDSNRSMDSKNSEKVKPAPKKDFSELKKDYRNLAANSAISITGDKSLCFASSSSQKQDDIFFEANEKIKRNSFDNKFFNVFRKDNVKNTILKRTSFFSLTGRSSTQMNFDNAFEKKTRMSIFNGKKTSAYDCMKNEFKQKKEIF